VGGIFPTKKRERIYKWPNRGEAKQRGGWFGGGRGGQWKEGKREKKGRGGVGLITKKEKTKSPCPRPIATKIKTSTTRG